MSIEKTIQSRGPRVGEVGTVRLVRLHIGNTYEYLVEYDYPIAGGHNGFQNNVEVKDGHCWWSYEYKLVPYEEDAIEDIDADMVFGFIGVV